MQYGGQDEAENMLRHPSSVTAYNPETSFQNKFSNNSRKNEIFSIFESRAPPLASMHEIYGISAITKQNLLSAIFVCILQFKEKANAFVFYALFPNLQGCLQCASYVAAFIV